MIGTVGQITDQNAAASQQMSTSAAQVSKVIGTVAAISEENSVAIQQVSASALEMNNQVQEIVASSQSLKEMASALEKERGIV